MIHFRRSQATTAEGAENLSDKSKQQQDLPSVSECPEKDGDRQSYTSDDSFQETQGSERLYTRPLSLQAEVREWKEGEADCGQVDDICVAPVVH